MKVQHSLCCSVTLGSLEISQDQGIKYNNNNNYLTGMLIWLPCIAVTILPMPYFGWKGFANRNDKYNNITTATMNAAKRYGRNIWVLASYNLTVIQGLWSGTETFWAM
jgi:hypothetical protein